MKTPMQPTHISIRIIDRAGFILGLICLPVTARLIDLEALRALGAWRVEVSK